MSTPELKPCPFCGETPTITPHTPVDPTKNTMMELWCCSRTCDVAPSIERPAREEAIAAWNTRAREAELEAEVARCRREILAAGNNPAGFDWSVLERLDRLEAAEAEVARLKGSVERLVEAGEAVEAFAASGASTLIDNMPNADPTAVLSRLAAFRSALSAALEDQDA